ncbi:hypothetical protein [Nostoc sp.]
MNKVTFGTNWIAQAEHGGFYQAIGTQLLMGSAVDFFMGYGMDTLNA